MPRISTQRLRLPGAALVVLGMALLPPVQAGGQTTDAHALGLGAQFQSYTFSEALGARVANLAMFPLAYTLPLGERFSLDLFGAYAHGSVERAGFTYTLSGPVDTRIRASYTVTPWAVLTAAVNLPTGRTAHDAEEAVVASVLSTDVLGFREASWGTGAAVTTGMATAYQAGEWGVGLGASYRLSNGFEPAAGSGLTFEPGDEIRFRVALDRNVGATGKLTAGATFQSFSEDQYGGRNLFQAGNRLRGDLGYAFRAGRSTWAAYAVNVWRERGDAFLDLVDGQGNIVGDTTLVVGSQNLLVVGLSGSVPVGSAFRIRPAFDFRLQSREEGDGEGWIAGGGADIPLRLFGAYDFFPRGRLSWGQLRAPGAGMKSLWGAELGFTLRWRF